MKDKRGEARSEDFFMEFPEIAKRLGIPQIALGGGEPSLFPDFIEGFSCECRKHGIILNMTTNGDGISEEVMDRLRHLTLISFSFDRFKIISRSDIESMFRKMELVRSHGIRTGMNIQLDPMILENLYPFLGEISKHSDNIYLLQSKPGIMDYGARERTRILGASSLFDNLYVDDSLRMCLGFSNSCGRGREIISVDSGGGVYGCSFDKPFDMLDEAGDLIEIVNENYPFEVTTHCPFV